MHYHLVLCIFFGIIRSMNEFHEAFQRFILWLCLCGVATLLIVYLAVLLRHVIKHLFGCGFIHGMFMMMFILEAYIVGATKPEGESRSVRRSLGQQEMTDVTAITSPRANRWNVHGAAEAFAPVDFGDWVFPFGSNHVSRFVVMTSGEVRSESMTGSRFIAVTNQMSCVPGLSRFLIESLPDDTRRFRWIDFARERDTNDVVSASLLLKRCGDWVTDINGIVTEHSRELPFAHDGFGLDDDWIAANFTNAEEIISVGYTNWVARTITENAPNGLFCLEVTFKSSPPEITRLMVGGYSIAVSEAG